MKRTMLALVLLLPLLVVAPARAATGCDTSVSAPADLQQRLNAAGEGKTVCLHGTFTTASGEIRPLHGQTIIGGTLRYTGPVRLCKCSDLNDGYDLHAGNVTLRNVEVQGFEGTGIVCGPGSVIDNAYVHDNHLRGIGCIMHNGDWRVQIRDSRIANNGSKVTEGWAASGIKLMEVSKPGHALGQGATITGNKSWANHGNGIWLDRTSNASIIANNETWNNTRHGIRCEKCGGPILIRDNISHDNHWYGIVVANTAMATIRNNTIYRNGWNSIGIEYSDVAQKTYPAIYPTYLGYREKAITTQGTRRR